MSANINPETGIPYGVISANCLHPELVDYLLHDSGTNLTEKEALKEHLHERLQEELTEEEFDDLEESDYESRIIGIDPFWDENFLNTADFDEPCIEGESEGVHYATVYFGGALNFFIFQSPQATWKARRGSPCCPNAGVLDTLDGDYMCYDVPKDWRIEE